MTWPALITPAGRQEAVGLTEGNSREWRKSHSQVCQTAEIDAAILEATMALLLRSWGAGLATWAPSSSCLKESWNSAGKTAARRVQGLQAPCTAIKMPVCLGWWNTSSRPQLLYIAIVTSIQFIPLQIAYWSTVYQAWLSQYQMNTTSKSRQILC